jgi:hypothetical protein
MNTEERLRDALHGEAAHIEPREGWNMIESRITTAAAPRNRTRYLMAAAAAALVLSAAVAVIATQDDTKTPVVTGPETTSAPTTTPAITPTTVVTPTTAVALDLGPHRGILWSQSAATPRAIADLFARDFLNMPNPNVGEYQAGDSRSGEIVVHPKPTGTLATTLSVRQFDGQWYVIAANAGNLELDAPATDARITSPVHLTGRSIAFEGQVQVAVLRYDTTLQCTVPTDVCGSDPGVYANTYFTGSGDEKRAFATDVTFTKPQSEYGYVVLWTNSAEDGTVSEATVRLIRFR